jgi:hypothetical protein
VPRHVAAPWSGISIEVQQRAPNPAAHRRVTIARLAGCVAVTPGRPTVDSTDPFGFSIDLLDIANENPNVIGSATATLHPADNAAVRGELYRSGFSASGTTGAAFVTSTFGLGHVAYWGDSSPIDDGTGQSGNTLFNGWNDPAGTDAALALNATQWLVGGSAGGGGGAAVRRPSAWSTAASSQGTPTGAWAPVPGWSPPAPTPGTHSLLDGGTVSSTQSATQQVTVPTGATSQTLSFRTWMTTSESGTTAYDKLNVQANGTTLKTFSNASTKGSWFTTSVDLSAYAGQTITLKFQAVNDSTLPTSFYVDAVSVLA